MIEDDDIIWQSEEMTVFAREMKVVGVMPPLPFYYEIAERDGGFYCDRIVVSEETLKEFCRTIIGDKTMIEQNEKVYVGSGLKEEHRNFVMLRLADLQDRVNILNGQIIKLEDKLKPVTIAPRFIETVAEVSELGEPISPIELKIAEIEVVTNIISANIESIMQNLRL